jgi:hypothetical protein
MALSPLLHLGELRRQTFHEELEPCGEIHLPLSPTLQCAVEAAAVAVIELAERKQALEVVARAVKAERGEESRCPPVPVDERMDVDELELRDPSDERRVNAGVVPRKDLRPRLTAKWRPDPISTNCDPTPFPTIAHV